MDKFKKMNPAKVRGFSQLKTLVGGIIYFIFGFIISVADFPMSTHPLGVALLSCAPKENGRLAFYNDFSFYMLCGGSILSTLTYTQNGIIYFTMYCALFFIRLALTSGRFNETRAVKMALALTSALCIGFVGGAINGFGLWEILGVLILSVCAPIFACLFDGSSNCETSPVFIQAAWGALLFALLYGMRTVHIFSFSLTLTISALFTLAAARKKGALYGALMGVVCGMAGENFVLPPVLGILGFTAGIFFEYSDIFAILAAYVGAICYGIYCIGFDAVGYLAPEFLIAVSTFIPVKSFILPEPSVPYAQTSQEQFCNSSESNLQLIKMSEAFSALSEIALDSEKCAKPDKNECLFFVKRAFEEVCGSCVMNGICRMSDEMVRESIKNKLGILLYEGGLGENDATHKLLSKCRYGDKITSSCLKRYGRASGEHKLPTRSRMLSGEYSTVSKLLRSTAQTRKNSTLLPNSFNLKRALEELKISYKTFDIKGTRRTVIDVIGVSSPSIDVSSDKIRYQIEKEMGFPVSCPEFYVKGNTEIMRVERCPSISLEYAKAACTKSGEQRNGDSITVFENDDDCFYSLICDGMGSGRDAAHASAVAAKFMEKLISSSSPEDISIEMLNNFLISKDNECFSTIDLLEIDKLEATASFIKAGAAPAFIIRKGKLHKISSNTPPAGILYNMTAEKTTMKLEKHDIIVMLSDGIIENGDLAPRLMELLTYGLEGAPNDMANRIISDACQQNGRRDDMSVAVMRIA